MCEYLRTEARYNTPDKNGETRRDRNTRFGVESPNVSPPKEGAYLLNWLKDAGRARRWDQGYPCTLALTDWQAWADITGNIVRHEEMAVLRDMDESYVYAVSKELSDQRQRETSSGSG